MANPDILSCPDPAARCNRKYAVTPRMWQNQAGRESERLMSDTGRRLHRSRSNRMIAGVCGGLAEWLGWDSTLVRILYVVLSLASAAFPGLLVYLILWVVMPVRQS